MINSDVEEYISTLEHPFKKEIQTIRKIILEASDKMEERVKWNAPSFYYKEDFAAFNLRATEYVHLILLFPKGIIKYNNDLLKGEYKDRRMMFFHNMGEIKSNKQVLEKVVKEWIILIEK